MPRRPKPGRPSTNASIRAKTGKRRGRKPIFSVAQKRVLERLIRHSLKTELRAMTRAI